MIGILKELFAHASLFTKASKETVIGLALSGKSSPKRVRKLRHYNYKFTDAYPTKTKARIMQDAKNIKKDPQESNAIILDGVYNDPHSRAMHMLRISTIRSASVTQIIDYLCRVDTEKFTGQSADPESAFSQNRDADEIYRDYLQILT